MSARNDLTAREANARAGITAQKPDGGPAFPCGGDLYSGMSLRDYFAGQALAGICAAWPHMKHPKEAEYGGWVPPADHVGYWAYRLADAMLAEREK